VFGSIYFTLFLTLTLLSDDVHTPEFLITINVSGIPNHKIKLKVGVPVMLLRNLDPTAGLCNAIRLIITKMGDMYLNTG